MVRVATTWPDVFVSQAGGAWTVPVTSMSAQRTRMCAEKDRSAATRMGLTSVAAWLVTVKIAPECVKVCIWFIGYDNHHHLFRLYIYGRSYSNLFKGPHGLTFTWWGCYGFCQGRNPAEPAHSFLFCSCVYFCLYGPFNCISFHEFSRQLSVFSLCSSGLISALLVLSTIYLLGNSPSDLI